MSAVTAPAPLNLQLRVPAEFARSMGWKAFWRLFLRLLAFETVLVLCDVYQGHWHFIHIGYVAVFSFFVFKPWLSLSSDSWIYIVTDEGVWLRDTSDPISTSGYVMMRWKQYDILGVRHTGWHGWPAVDMSLRHKGKEVHRLLVLRPDSEDAVDDKLLPWLMARLPVSAPDATPVG